MKLQEDIEITIDDSGEFIFPRFRKALGVVLSQGEIGKDKPIAYISRSLNNTKEEYATNEKEMLAIVWALDNLRN